MGHRPLILHLTADYPDPVRDRTTKAVERFIDGLTNCDHVVISLKRQGNPAKTYFTDCGMLRGRRVFAHGYFAPPLGVGQLAVMWGIARRVRATLAGEGIRPDLIHAHRLTFEGFAGWFLSRWLKLPIVYSVRGEVEQKILRFKPTYRPIIRKMVREAARIYYVSAWFRPQLERFVPVTPHKSRLLPNIVENTRQPIVPVAPDRRIAIVLHYQFWRRKGLDRLIAAFARVADRLPGVALDVIGGGDVRFTNEVIGLVERSGCASRIRLLGAMDNAQLLQRLPGYLALAVPARNETFGMVYTEALFSGVPILYGRGTGIDGYLDGLDIGVGVDPLDIDEIAAGLTQLVERNAELRRAIAVAAPELCRRFEPSCLLAMYQKDVLDVTDLKRAPG